MFDRVCFWISIPSVCDATAVITCWKEYDYDSAVCFMDVETLGLFFGSLAVTQGASLAAVNGIDGGRAVARNYGGGRRTIQDFLK